ncbi:Tex family protein [Aliibacillus thermotolerans]|uniref:Tex family protein n=1 Tax=Aliibacillus thermotolerans TaxID=1834418 RepID=A0ABW0UAD4_9BACI|nr:Tex family protein [Aliibacillus thermotolerans]MDA3129590.1 S1 RNA-binding domain-containing protein [Aliibacillus thermotolerans]
MVSDQTVEQQIIQQIGEDLKVHTRYVKNIITLLEEGNTVPFIARYRKEKTGEANEVLIRQVQEAWHYANQLQARKNEVIRLIDEQGKLTKSLEQSIKQANKLQEVEDLYRPYRQKRRTRATIAKEKGLEPLALFLMSQPNQSIEAEAEKYISSDKGIENIEDALQGAMDIIAEQVADDPDKRKKIRSFTFQNGTLKVAKKKDADDPQSVYEMYYDYEEPIKHIPSHRVLAVNRGEKENVLRVTIAIEEEKIYPFVEKGIVSEQSASYSYLKDACKDAYQRLIAPAIEREIRKELSEKAEERAIYIFSENLKNLLLEPPMKGKIVLGVDPAYRTGCKLAVVDELGTLKKTAVIYPAPPKNEIEESKKVVKKLVEEFNIEVIVIGNGTASRETEEFIADLIPELDRDVAYLIVNEAGASVYSASSLGREEFPELETEERSAVSIARRFQDPLAELVKIDPKSIGVGQYQHDVSQSKLNDSLTFVVETAVNQVGVDVNTASASLLQYVAGLSKSVAVNIVKRREEKGKFHSRKELQQVPRLGAKTYEQAAGFLRIVDGKEPLDRTAIHPESYDKTLLLLKEIGVTVDEVGTETIKKKLEKINEEEIANLLDIGIPTLKDIIEDLKRPNRDPRDELPPPILKTGIMKMEDLQKGLELRGTVRNVVDFGAFVDIGVKQDGLVHISKLAPHYVKHPLDEVAVGNVVTVWVEDVDVDKERISLTMIPPIKQTEK